LTAAEKNRANVRAWRKANPEKAREAKRRQARRARARDPETHRRRTADYDRRNREAANARKRKGGAVRRARQRAQFVEVVVPAVVLERGDGRCGICLEPVDPSNFHIDHIIPLARGGEHSYANSQPAHPLCNQQKGDR
jgi:5-methylcytosine-specific restriction endonuclease McrA